MTKKGDRVVLGLDMDGVIIDNTKSKILFAKKLGYALTPDQTPADFIESIMTEEDLGKLRQLLYLNPETALKAGLVEGAKNGLAALKTAGVRYFLISRRKNPEIARATLKKRGLWPTYLNETNAFFVERPEDKNIKAGALGITAYIDDQPSVLAKLTDVPGKFLMDRFAKFGDLPFAHTKVSSWPEFLSHIL